ncbi:MAG: 50S ribosomal protein L9, partial [Candidatus Paceibacteria bacterium]
VVEVADGYARNYLIPQRMANYANAQEVERAQQLREQREAEEAERQKHAAEVAEKVQGYTLTVARSAGENGHLYGRAADVASGLQSAGFDVDEETIALRQPIEYTGSYTISLTFEPKNVEITLNVEAA